MKYKIFLLLVLLSSTAMSDTGRIGLVKTVTPDSVLLKKSSQDVITFDTRLYVGTTIKTNSNGSVGAIFNDGSILTLGPNSIITISDYKFNPVEKKVGFASRLIKGTLAYESGAINRIVPGSVVFDTPAGKLQLHGTKILVDVETGIVDEFLNFFVPFDIKDE